jgi:hypothetical protein
MAVLAGHRPTVHAVYPVADDFHWFQPWEWTEHSLRVLTALGTAGAVIVAIVLALARWVFDAGNRPRLILTHDPTTDQAEETAGVPMFGFPGQTMTTPATMNTPAAYLRLGVSNKRGRRAASGVEVLVVRVEALEQDQIGEKKTVWEGPVSNLGLLGWTHIDPPGLTIGPGIRRTVDLGRQLTEHPYFTLGVVPPPRGEKQKLTPGTYRLTLAAGGANTDAQHYALTLWFDGRWKMSESVGDHMKITDGPKRVKPPA